MGFYQGGGGGVKLHVYWWCYFEDNYIYTSIVYDYLESEFYNISLTLAQERMISRMTQMKPPWSDLQNTEINAF